MSPSRSTFLLHARLCGSASEFAELDDVSHGRPIERRFNRIEQTIASYRGEILEQQWMQQKIGFRSADAAALAAREMQQRCAVLPQVTANYLTLRIGIHREYMQRRAADAHKAPEAHTEHLMSLDDGILLSENVCCELNNELQKTLRAEAHAPACPRCYRLNWRLEIPTTAYASLPLLPNSVFSQPPGSSLLLYQGLKTIALPAESPLITIGRDPENDLVLSDDCVSRRHCWIERQQDRVVLTDASTNGTCILNNLGEEFLVRKGRFTLRNDGFLFFGRRCLGERRGSIRYEVC